MSNKSLLLQHYTSFNEGLRLQHSRVRRLEFETTVHVVTKRLPARATILELGAGTGAYSLHFARTGHVVTATDLIDHYVDAIRAQAHQEGLSSLQAQQADATNLTAFSDGAFQAVLCLGPYYHLRTRALRRKCLLECRRVAGAQGIIAIAYINLVSAVSFLLQTGQTLTQDQYDSLRRHDDSRADYPDEFFNITHFTTQEAVEEELRSCGLEIIDHAGTDGAFGFFRNALEGISDQAFENYRAFHFQHCCQSDLRGASAHRLIIAKKR